MPKPHTLKPPYPAQFPQQIVELVQAWRKPSKLPGNLIATSPASWAGCGPNNSVHLLSSRLRPDGRLFWCVPSRRLAFFSQHKPDSS